MFLIESKEYLSMGIEFFENHDTLFFRREMVVLNQKSKLQKEKKDLISQTRLFNQTWDINGSMQQKNDFRFFPLLAYQRELPY